jgi:hypothetical protein
MGWLGNPAFRDADDIGAKWLKAKWKEETREGRTSLSFRAWSREQGFFTGGNPTGWDDLRRVSMVPLSSVMLAVGEGGSPGGEREPEMAPLVSIDGPRRRRSLRRRRRRLPPSLDKTGR